jgi:hypothetical protein
LDTQGSSKTGKPADPVGRKISKAPSPLDALHLDRQDDFFPVDEFSTSFEPQVTSDADDLNISQWIGDSDFLLDPVFEQSSGVSPWNLYSRNSISFGDEINQSTALNIDESSIAPVVSNKDINLSESVSNASSTVLSRQDGPSNSQESDRYGDNGCQMGDSSRVVEKASSTAMQKCILAIRRQQTSRNSPGLPSPQQNHIRINHVSFIAACLANLSQLGVSSKAASLDDCESPFFRPALSREIHEGMSSAIQTTFGHLKPDLQPRAAQISFNHHPYIDVLPLPDFRERVITLLSLPLPCFDEEELCSDLLNDGLICWGSNAGAGSGAPWDARSWEVAPWFMKKWWMLLGGKMGAMYQQTQWWRAIRGIHTEINW